MKFSLETTRPPWPEQKPDPTDNPRRSRKSLGLMALLMVAAGSCHLLAQLPLNPGESVATCYSGASGGFSVVVLDTRDPAANAPGVNQNWPLPPYHDGNWRRDDFGGEVFGIALDGASPPNIYVTSTTCYIGTVPGTGQIHRIDASSGAVTLFATLPNEGSGLGNIAYDPVHDQFFVTNFHDGKIYRLDTSGNLIQDFDPGSPFDPNQSNDDFVPLGDRPWGIGVFQNRVYYGMWSEDARSAGNAGPNRVFSVALDGSGGILPGETLEVSLLPKADGKTLPVADIAFSQNGQMLVAERGMARDQVPTAHQSRVLEYTGGHLAWATSGNSFLVGVNEGTNASGGVAYACTRDGESLAMATGDALHYYPSDRIYGLQIFPIGGGAIANSYLIDFDQETTVNDKNQIGDVEVYSDCTPPCLEIVPCEVLCTTDDSGDLIWRFRVKNVSDFQAYHLFLNKLPAGVTASPDYFSFADEPGGFLAQNAISECLEVRLANATPGETADIQFAMHQEDLDICCATDYPLELPGCDCAQLLAERVRCRAPGYSYTFTLENLSPLQVDYILVVPVDPTVTISQSFAQVGPLAYGDSQQVTVNLSGTGLAGKEVCLRISTHTQDFRVCCSILKCIRIPRRPWFCYFELNDNFETNNLGNGAGFSSGSGFEISGFGDSGEDGVRFTPVDPSIGATFEWDPLPPTIPVGGFLKFSATGLMAGEDRPLGELQITNVGAGLDISADYSAVGSDTQRLEFYRGDTLIHVETGHRGAVGRGFDWPTGCGKTIVYLGDITTACYFPVWPRPQTFPLRNGTTIDATGVRILAEEPEAPLDSLTSFSIRGARIPAMVLHTAGASRDCNGNHLPDEDEIADGLLGDYNGNGILDACEDLAPGHQTNLNTGYDQVGDATIARGGNDDDWLVVNPSLVGPAQVVANPVSSWPAPFAKSDWISVNGQGGTSVSGVDTISFERTFCLSRDAGFAVLELTFFADDQASVSLNGQTLTGTIGQFNAGFPAQVHYAGPIGGSLFRPGLNVLRLDVEDTQRVRTGLNLVGTVKSDGPGCEGAAH